MNKPKRKYRTVYISKAYFPKELWPKGFTDQYCSWTYLTATRKEAADKAWLEHKHELLPLMLSTVRRIGLNVDGESRNNCAGRLTPISVAVLDKAPQDYEMPEL